MLVLALGTVGVPRAAAVLVARVHLRRQEDRQCRRGAHQRAEHDHEAGHQPPRRVEFQYPAATWPELPRRPRARRSPDIDAEVYCGPVLFVDGTTTKTYLGYTVRQSSTKNGAAVLAASSTPVSQNPQAAPSGRTLVRPDKIAPNANSTLAVPSPPPAAAGVFSTTVDLSGQSLPSAPSNAVIGSRNGGVKITNLGPIKRYGHGDDARSAPTGQKTDRVHDRCRPERGRDRAVPVRLHLGQRRRQEPLRAQAGVHDRRRRAHVDHDGRPPGERRGRDAEGLAAHRAAGCGQPRGGTAPPPTPGRPAERRR